MKITTTHILIGVALIGIVLLVGSSYLKKEPAVEEVATGTYTALAQCIKESGALFYGAFWCPHCQDQKAMFGDAVSELPYIECSTPDKKSQTQACIDAEITGYPTWKFADGTEESGTVSLQKLAEKTACSIE